MGWKIFDWIASVVIGTIVTLVLVWTFWVIMNDPALRQLFGGLFLLAIPVAVLYAKTLAPWLRKDEERRKRRWDCEHTLNGDWDMLSGEERQRIADRYRQAHQASERYGGKGLEGPPAGWDTGFTPLLRRARRQRRWLVKAGLDRAHADRVVYQQYLPAFQRQQLRQECTERGLDPGAEGSTRESFAMMQLRELKEHDNAQ